MRLLFLITILGVSNLSSIKNTPFVDFFTGIVSAHVVPNDVGALDYNTAQLVSSEVGAYATPTPTPPAKACTPAPSLPTESGGDIYGSNDPQYTITYSGDLRIKVSEYFESPINVPRVELNHYIITEESQWVCDRYVLSYKWVEYDKSVSQSTFFALAGTVIETDRSEKGYEDYSCDEGENGEELCSRVWAWVENIESQEHVFVANQRLSQRSIVASRYIWSPNEDSALQITYDINLNCTELYSYKDTPRDANGNSLSNYQVTKIGPGLFEPGEWLLYKGPPAGFVDWCNISEELELIPVGF